MTVHAKGTQVQRFYADDPNTMFDETMIVTYGIHDEIRTTQYGLRLACGFHF